MKEGVEAFVYEAARAFLEHPKAIFKFLSRNDVGETGSHQRGILIPIEEGIISLK